MPTPEELEQIRVLLERSLAQTRSENPTLGMPDPNLVAQGLSLVAKTLANASTTLGISPPPVEFSLDEHPDSLAEIRGRSGSGTLQMNIDAGYFLQQAYSLGDDQPSVAHNLAETVGHEAYHAYVADRYPRTDEATLMANDMGGDAYKNDRGERAATRFGQMLADGEQMRRRRS